MSILVKTSVEVIYVTHLHLILWIEFQLKCRVLYLCQPPCNSVMMNNFQLFKYCMFEVDSEPMSGFAVCINIMYSYIYWVFT